MNIQRVFWAGVVIFVYTFLYEFVLHSFILQGMYADHENLLRQQDQSSFVYALLMLVGFMLMSFGFSYIFAKGYENKGIVEGLRFGLLIGAAFGVSSALIEFSVFPIPDSWIWAWVVGYLVQWIIAGLIAAALYRPK